MTTQTAPKAVDERTILIIDNELSFIRNGWFFNRVYYSDEGYETRPYLDFVNQQKPDWKSYRVHSEYYMEGEWRRRSTACGEVRL